MNHTDFISRPGFLYRIGSEYYYLGKWICLKCENTDASDTHFMYELSLKEKHSPELNLYFQRLRAYSDFALIPPFNAAAVRDSQDRLLESLSDIQQEDLKRQIESFQSCAVRFAGLPA